MIQQVKYWDNAQWSTQPGYVIDGKLYTDEAGTQMASAGSHYLLNAAGGGQRYVMPDGTMADFAGYMAEARGHMGHNILAPMITDSHPGQTALHNADGSVSWIENERLGALTSSGSTDASEADALSSETSVCQSDFTVTDMLAGYKASAEAEADQDTLNCAVTYEDYQTDCLQAMAQAQLNAFLQYQQSQFELTQAQLNLKS